MPLRNYSLTHSLAGNAGCKKLPKNRHLGTIAQLCQAVSSQLRHISTIGKNLLNSNISSTCPHDMANFGRLSPEIDFVSLRHPSKFQRVSSLGLVTAATTLNEIQPNFARCLTVSWRGTLYRPIYFRGGVLPRNGILPGAKFTFRPSLALSYIGSVTAQHSSSGRQPNFAALSRERHLYLTGRPSRWALAHSLVCLFCVVVH